MTCIIVRFKNNDISPIKLDSQELIGINHLLSKQSFIETFNPTVKDYLIYSKIDTKLIENFPNIKRWHNCLTALSVQEKLHYMNFDNEKVNRLNK